MKAAIAITLVLTLVLAWKYFEHRRQKQKKPWGEGDEDRSDPIPRFNDANENGGASRGSSQRNNALDDSDNHMGANVGDDLP